MQTQGAAQLAPPDYAAEAHRQVQPTPKHQRQPTPQHQQQPPLQHQQPRLRCQPLTGWSLRPNSTSICPLYQVVFSCPTVRLDTTVPLTRVAE